MLGSEPLSKLNSRYRPQSQPLIPLQPSTNMKLIPIINQCAPKNPEAMPRVSLDAAHYPFKMLAHSDAVRKFVEGDEFNPIHMRLGLTGACNMRCNFCNFHSPNENTFYDLFSYKDAIDTGACIRLLEQFSESGGRAVTLCGSGENTVHNGFAEICKKAVSFGLKLGIITNGSRLHDSSISECIAETHTWVRIGMNAGSDSLFSKITHAPAGTFEKMLSSIRRLRENARSSDFRIGLNYVITAENWEEIELAARRASDSGSHYIRFEPEFYSSMGHETIEEVLSEITKSLNNVALLADQTFEVSIPKLDRGPMDRTNNIEGDFESCHYSRFVTAVGADGNLYPCPQVHLNSRYRIGNVVEEGYKKVLTGGPRAEWEAKNPSREDLCKSCFYRPQNELLQKLKDGRLEASSLLQNYMIEVPNTLHKDFV